MINCKTANIAKRSNNQFYSIIKNFCKISGIPAVLNTSLNLHGYPISSTLRYYFYI